MSVWFCVPSARPRAEADAALAKWRAQGYRIALWRDSDQDVPLCDLLLTGPYPGYSQAVNALVREVLRRDPRCEWTVTGGDDIDPDPHNTAEQIAVECTAHFGGTFGIMQPTGDSWADYSIRRICGSPWMGREFCERAYGGNGPMWHEYFHMFNDEEMQHVALRLKCLWQRDDLTHLHHHWQRESDQVVRGKREPAFLKRANSRENWEAMGAIFRARLKAGFPGHEPAPAMVTR